MTNEALLAGLVAAQGSVPADCLARLCESGLAGSPPPDLATMSASGLLVADQDDGAVSYRAPRAAPDPDALDSLHDRALLRMVDGDTRQGTVKARLAAYGIALRAERLETLRAGGRLENPAPGIWRPANRAAEVQPERAPTCNERIVELIQESGPLPLHRIAAALAPDFAYNQTRMALRRLGKAGALARHGELWQLAEGGVPQPIDNTPLNRRVEEILTIDPGAWSLEEMRLCVGWNIGAERVRAALEACAEKEIGCFVDTQTFRTPPAGDPAPLIERIARYAGLDADLLIATAYIWETDPDAPSGISTSRVLRAAGYPVEAPRLRTALEWLGADSDRIVRVRSDAQRILEAAGVPLCRTHDKRRRIGNRGGKLGSSHV